jgi:quinol monooxygenase YgiN
MVIIHLKVPAEKCKELSQTIFSLLSSIRGQKGCVRCDFYHRTEEENFFCLLEEWDAQKNLDLHYGSESFKILRGAMNLLEEPGEIITYQCLPPAGKIEGRREDAK